MTVGSDSKKIDYSKLNNENISVQDYQHSCIRGGVSQCSNRYATTNYLYMRQPYNPLEEDPYLFCLDINNQYGAAMTEFLPYCNTKWVENISN